MPPCRKTSLAHTEANLPSNRESKTPGTQARDNDDNKWKAWTKTCVQLLLPHRFRFSSKQKIPDEHLTQSHFCHLQVGPSESSYLKFGIVFQPHFPSPSPAPTGLCRTSQSSSSSQKKPNHLERASYSTALVSPRHSPGMSQKATMVNAEATSVHLFHKPYWGALALWRGIKLVPTSCCWCPTVCISTAERLIIPKHPDKTSAKQISSSFWSPPAWCIENASIATVHSSPGRGSHNTWFVIISSFCLKVVELGCLGETWCGQG